MGREDLREEGEDLRSLGQRVGELGEQLGLLAQSYRDVFERLRIALKDAENPALADGPPSHPARGPTKRPGGVPRRATDRSPSPAANGSVAPEEMDECRQTLRMLLDRQGELGRQLLMVSRHRLFQAGGEEPRKIRVRLQEFADRCLGLRLSSESMIRGSAKGVLSLLDDLSEIDSRACEDFQRFGAGLRARAEGLLSGRKEDRRYLQGDSWRRTW